MSRSAFLRILPTIFAAWMLSMPSAHAWESSHGPRQSTGYTPIMTAVIGQTPLTIPNLGTFAAGNAPVIGSDGRVYIGNERGRLYAFEANGTRLWQRDLGSGFSIRTAVTVGHHIGYEYLIYVLGSRVVRDHTQGTTIERGDVALFAFDRNGQQLWQVPLPHFDAKSIGVAPPNLWQHDRMNAVIVSLIYKARVGPALTTHLFAVSRSGGLINSVKVASVVPQVSGGGDWLGATCGNLPLLCLLPSDFELTAGPAQDDFERLPSDLTLPFPGPAVSSTGRPSPLIVVSDGLQNVVGYRFTGTQFGEVFRRSDQSAFRTMTSPPVMRDQSALIGTAKGIQSFPSGQMVSPLQGLATTPTIGGQGVYLAASSQVQFLSRDGTLRKQVLLNGQSAVPAAVSLNHLFVSTANTLRQFDLETMEQVGEVNWVGGGTVAPAIGRNGWVYAMASNVLFVFPPRRNPAIDDTTSLTGGNTGGNTGTNPGVNADVDPGAEPSPGPNVVPGINVAPGTYLPMQPPAP